MRTMLRSLLVLSLVVGFCVVAVAADIETTPQAKAYRASVKAIDSGDVKAYQGTLASEAVQEMEEERRRLREAGELPDEKG